MAKKSQLLLDILPDELPDVRPLLLDLGVLPLLPLPEAVDDTWAHCTVTLAHSDNVTL